MIIGICGKSGCGKSTLANQIIELTDNKAIHLDIDKVGHRVLLLPEVQEELVSSFGESVVRENSVDRKKLGEIVFDSRKEMNKLSDITWKYMQIEIDNFLNLHKDKIIILDWLLLSISKYFDMCDIKILLDIPYEIRKQRAMKRDNISEEAFDLREKASIEFDESAFDYVIKANDKEIVKKVGEIIMTKVLYPGSFDPMTKGHMNIVEQASDLFDEVIIAVMQNPLKKSGLFTLEERMEIIKELYQRMNNVRVISGSGAAVDVALLNECKAIIRGLRSLSDYDYEVQLQQMNKEISNNKVNTICLFADKEYQFVSSSMVKEVLNLDKDISRYVDPIVRERMLVKKRSLIR